jgi:hypothetical protein
MRRRFRASGEATKAQRRKTVARKTRVASKTARPRHSSAPGRETKVARLTNELNKTRQQRTATRRSTFDLRVRCRPPCRADTDGASIHHRKVWSSDFCQLSTRQTALATLINRM